MSSVRQVICSGENFEACIPCKRLLPEETSERRHLQVHATVMQLLGVPSKLACWNGDCGYDTSAAGGKPPFLHRCLTCKVALYCGRKCQQIDWAFHAQECLKIIKTSSALARAQASGKKGSAPARRSNLVISRRSAFAKLGKAPYSRAPIFIAKTRVPTVARAMNQERARYKKEFTELKECTKECADYIDLFTRVAHSSLQKEQKLREQLNVLKEKSFEARRRIRQCEKKAVYLLREEQIYPKNSHMMALVMRQYQECASKFYSISKKQLQLFYELCQKMPLDNDDLNDDLELIMLNIGVE